MKLSMTKFRLAFYINYLNNLSPEKRAFVEAANAQTVAHIKARIATRVQKMRDTKGTPEFKEWLSPILKAAQNRPEVKEKVRTRSLEAISQPEVKARLIEGVRRAFSNPETRAKRNAAVKAAHGTPEARARASATNTATHARPGYKAKFTAAAKEAQNRPEVRAVKSHIQKKNWEDPTYRAKVTAKVQCPHCEVAGAKFAMSRYHFDRCKHNPHPPFTPEEVAEHQKKNSELAAFAARKSWEGERKKKEYVPVTCPHCGKQGLVFIMKRWHFDKCKFKPQGDMK